MAAKDYEIVTGMFFAYIAKKRASTNKEPLHISADRKVITDNEIIGLFEFYLRKYFEENDGEDTVVITKGGKKIFEATLLDKDSEC